MPIVELDGIVTHYEVAGSGPPVLMFSPGGFDSSLQSWRTVGIYRRLALIEQLAARYSCVMFDRRESGHSGGRVERLSWAHYVSQARGLLDHLGIERAHVMGGCVGCSTAAALAVAAPARVLSMVLYSPAGGVHYRLKQHERFRTHLVFVAENGLPSVVDLVRSHDLGFSKDPRVGPWAAVIRRDESFAQMYGRMDRHRYEVMVTGMARMLFDRDTVPGLEPEDLLNLDVPALIVPGQDTSHAPSAARYLQECLPNNEYWDVPVAEQTADNAPARVLQFLDEHA
jgi:pimeloyl-ACP methyl ester carboxylesterase